MTDISNSELRRLDLTVLLVFLGLLRHRKATVVAAELGLTQSAISHALQRLRDIFDDPLFLRRPHGLEPTATALSCEAPVRAAVEALRAALGGRAAFDPATARRVVRIAALDAEQAAIVPGLVKAIAEEAPGLQLVLSPLARKAALQGLIDGTLDLALGFFTSGHDQILAEDLYHQGFLVVGRPEVLGAGPLTLARYAALPHVLVSPGGDLRGIADEALEAEGLTRRVLASVPEFFPALATVAETGCIAALPDRLARRYAPALGLALAEPPLALRSFPVSVLRHRRNEADGCLGWLIAALQRGLAAP